VGYVFGRVGVRGGLAEVCHFEEAGLDFVILLLQRIKILPRQNIPLTPNQQLMMVPRIHNHLFLH